MTIFKYRGTLARQNAERPVITIAARASDILKFARIARAGRTADGTLHGFQRPKIASHIREIRDYLSSKDAVLPNPIVVAFVAQSRCAKVKEVSHGIGEVTIEVKGDGPPGFVVDGQQRLTALSELPEKDFEIFVAIMVVRDFKELQEQFLLINSIRSLPKALIYELMVGARGLPTRLASRSFAAALTERLNFDRKSSLRRKIYQHTNPKGVIRDTAIQKIIMQSVSDGAIRAMPESKQFSGGFKLISEFFAAVQVVFSDAWHNHTPKTSRLVHGAGIQALGYVMELLVARDGASTQKEFERGLSVLEGKTAWTSGSWRFSESEQLPWNALENTPRQILGLAQYLVSTVRRESQKEFRLVSPVAAAGEARKARR